MLSRRQAPARGLSLVELMIGVVVGLFVVAGAAYFVVNFSAENRRLLLEARLTQDMRAAMDIVTRDVRRAGYWQNAASGVSIFGAAPPSVVYGATGFGALSPASGASASSISYAYDKSASASATSADQFAFSLNNGTLFTVISGSASQPLTDPNLMTVTKFDVSTAVAQESIACPASSATPSVFVRKVTITMAASSVADPSVARTLTNTVRIRNDLTNGSC
jgi:type IV pilus assembly protein PilW